MSKESTNTKGGKEEEKAKKRPNNNKPIKGLTTRQQKLVKALAVDDMTMAQATKAAGYASRTGAYQALSSEAVRRQFHIAYEANQLTPKKIVKHIKDLMEAKEEVHFKDQLIGYKADNAARVRATELAIKVYGGLDSRNFESDSKQSSELHIHLNGVVPDTVISGIEKVLRNMDGAREDESKAGQRLNEVIDVEVEPTDES